MKRILTALALLLPLLTLGAGPTFGGNLSAIRPGNVLADTPAFDRDLSYLKQGDVARVPALEWEVLWDPNGAYDYRGIDLMIKKMVTKGVVPVWLLQPSPFPSSPWYATPWPDRWMPKRDLWPAIVAMNTKIAQHIVTETAKYPSFYPLARKPLFQVWNEPQGGKPGGSIYSQFGEWPTDLHEFLYLLVNDLRLKNIPKTQIIGPALSSFGEGTRGEAAEFASMMPPPEFDWLSQCGFRACHIRFSASWARGNLPNVQMGFQDNLNWVNWLTGRYKFPVDQKVIVTEFYVTPGDCGVPIGTDMYPYHAIAFDLLKTSTFSHVLGYGLGPNDGSSNDPWQQYGGLGPSLVRWRG